MLPAREAGIDTEAFKRFVEQCGPEIAKGYVMAFFDLLPRIKDIRDAPGEAGKRKEAFALHNYVKCLLHLISDLSLDKELVSNANVSLLHYIKKVTEFPKIQEFPEFQ